MQLIAFIDYALFVLTFGSLTLATLLVVRAKIKA